MSGPSVKPLRASAAELAIVTRDRRRILLTVLPIVALACLAGAGVIASGPRAHAFDPWLFGATGVLLLPLWLLARSGRLAYWPAATVTLLATGALVLTRMVSLFTGESAADPDVSLMNSIFAYYPGYFTLLSMLVPYPRSVHWSIAAWLAAAGLTTAMTVPHWGGTPPREGLLALLTLVWFGYPIFLALTAGAARRHLRMVQLHAAEAQAAREANRLARASAHRFQGIFDQAAVGMSLLDTSGRWLQVNPRQCEITGYGAEELKARHFQDITHPDDVGEDVRQARRLARGEIASYSIEKRYVRKDGSIVWVSVFRSRLAGVGGEPDRFVTAVEDISARKAAEEQLSALHGDLERRIERRTHQLQASTARWQDQNARLQLMMELAGLLASARDEAAVWAAAGRFLPRIFDGIGGRLAVIDPRTGLRAVAAEWGTAAGAGQVSAALVAQGHSLGTLALNTQEPVDGALLGTVAEQIALAIMNTRLRAELEGQAIRDPMTGLYNRRHLNDALPRAIAAARRNRTALSVVVLDVDHFTRFTDTYGHECGVDVLIEVANAVSASLREGDLAFRQGGEEFVAVLAPCRAAEAIACAERIRAAVGALRLTHKGRALPPITLSAGVATMPQDGSTMDQLLDVADGALYRAKHDGRNCVRLYRQAA